jgi:DNA-binding transcriptional LysR family regulator
MFVRTSRGREATPRGAAVVAQAHKILRRVNQRILNTPRFAPEEAKTEFSFAMPDVGEMLFTPTIMRAFQQHAPHAVMRSSSYAPAQLEQAMESGAVDLALGYFPDLKGSSFFQQRLITHGFSCMLRAGHPAARTLTREAFGALEHVVVEAPIRSRDLIERYFERHGIARRIAMRTTHYLTLPMIVADSDLIATVPSAIGTVFAKLGKVELVPAPYRIPTFPICQHWHRRFDQDPRNEWLRQQIARLFGPTSGWAF